MWWFILVMVLFFIWAFIFFPFNIAYMLGLCKSKMPDVITISCCFIIGPGFLIIPIFFFIYLLGESIGLWTIRWARYNLSLQKEDTEEKPE